MLKGKLSATSQNLCGSLSPASAGYILQEKSVIPSSEVQEITADVGYGGLKSVTVSAIPQNYGKITYNGSTITVS